MAALSSWSDHACANCLGTLLVRTGADNDTPVYECGTCSRTARGSPDAICGCGTLPKLSARSKPDAPGEPRFRCVPNPARAMPGGACSPAVVVRWGVQP